MMLSISLPLTGGTVLTLPAAAIILTVMIHFSQPYFREQQQVLGAVNGIIEEDFAGQNVIQVFDRAEASIEEFDRQNDRLFISGWRSQFLSGLMMPLMSLVGNMGYVGVVVVGAQLALTGNATMWMAVFADTGTCLIVVANAMRMLRMKPRLDRMAEEARRAA